MPTRHGRRQPVAAHPGAGLEGTTRRRPRYVPIDGVTWEQLIAVMGRISSDPGGSQRFAVELDLA
ncbi:MAG: hypothetical protein M3237_03480 [Actinomycetota bacterium]|nr:hypothetical protein [Actinomycetota bacterium]